MLALRRFPVRPTLLLRRRISLQPEKPPKSVPPPPSVSKTPAAKAKALKNAPAAAVAAVKKDQPSVSAAPTRIAPGAANEKPLTHGRMRSLARNAFRERCKARRAAYQLSLLPKAQRRAATKTGTKRRRRRDAPPIPRQRAPISLFNPREWNRPLKPGVLKAYDLALNLIEKDSKALKLEAEQLKEQINTLENSDTDAKAEQAKKLKDKLEIIEVQSEINLPSVRWKCANGMADLTKPVDNYLIRQRWRSEGTLDLLMERLHQMNVVPDIVPDCHPSLDLRVSIMAPLKEHQRTGKVFTDLVPGDFLSPSQTKACPNLYADIFHTDTRLYTLFMVDPDVPDPENQSFKTYLHWLQPNIPLSASKRTRIGALNQHTSYIPPHPQQGSPYHRYCIFLLEQPSPTKPIEVPSISLEERAEFDTRLFMGRYGLNPGRGGGASMFREIWKEDTATVVSEIYENILKTPEPKFGRPPKVDPYDAFKTLKRYV